MRINQNITAIKTQGALSVTNTRLDKSIEKLSSGLRINRASDDAAGLAISEKLRRQIRGLNRATLNAQDGISMIQTAEGSLNESQSILQRMRELAIQAGNDTLTSNDRLEIQKEVTQLRDDLNRISRNTEFNTKKLLDGSQTASISSSSIAAKGLVNGSNTGGIGGDYSVSLALINGGISQMMRTQIFTIKDQEPTMLGNGNTKLVSIAQFYDANGVFVLENPQQINLIGNDSATSITIDGQTTLDRLAAQLQNAVNASSGLNIDNSKVALVNTVMTGVSGLGSYVQIVSGTIGRDGNIGVLADQPVLSALGFSTTRQAKDNLYEVTLMDDFGNTRQIRTETDKAVGLLDGVDITFASQSAQIAGTTGVEKGLVISGGDQRFTVSVGGAVQFIVTITEGVWTMSGLARSIQEQLANAAMGNMSGVSTIVVDGELRVGFTPSATSNLQSTITIAGASGARTLGFLNGTFSGFTDGRKDQTEVTDVFSQYDGTRVATDVVMSVGDGVNVFAVTVLQTISVSTNPDGVRFVDYQRRINSALETNSVQVRLDLVNGALAFTAERVGKENRNGLPSIESVVTLRTDAAGVTLFNNKFGFDASGSISARGSGDKNFRLHVVDNTPQYQIGADQGQSMGVAFADMSAEALGVDSLDLTNIAGAQTALGKLNVAIDRVSSERSKLGAFQNRLEYAINNLRSTSSNLTAAESRIRDADVAQEMVEFTRNQLVSQSGTAMLAQANTLPQNVMQLLR